MCSSIQATGNRRLPPILMQGIPKSRSPTMRGTVGASNDRDQLTTAQRRRLPSAGPLSAQRCCGSATTPLGSRVHPGERFSPDVAGCGFERSSCTPALVRTSARHAPPQRRTPGVEVPSQVVRGCASGGGWGSCSWFLQSLGGWATGAESAIIRVRREVRSAAVAVDVARDVSGRRRVAACCGRRELGPDRPAICDRSSSRRCRCQTGGPVAGRCGRRVTTRGAARLISAARAGLVRRPTRPRRTCARSPRTRRGG